jgi:hypothetical protein
MRATLLIIFFVCIYLHFQTTTSNDAEVDVLSTKQASIQKVPAVKSSLPSMSNQSLVAIAADPSVEIETDELIADAEVGEDFDEDDLSQLPWDDIEEGWKNHLKEFLVSVDPDKADEMFNAYMEEKKKYVDRVDFSDRDSSLTEELTTSSSDPLMNNETKEGLLERGHLDNLREIFGSHYSQVETLHKDYVESVQYLNRSPVKFSISL